MWVLHHIFFVFRVGMLFRNFDLEWIRFPEFPDLGFLHGRLKAFGVQSLLREGIVKLHFCCWLDLFFTRPKLAFLWWYLSRCSCPEAPECFRVLPPVVTRAAGWQASGRGGGKETTAVVCASFLIPCVKSITALEFWGIIRLIYYFIFLAHFILPLKQFPSVSQKASICCEPLRPPFL